MKKVLSVLMVLTVLIFVGCSTNEDENGSQVDVVLSLANSSDYYIGTMVGEKVKGAFEEVGASVQVMDAATDVATQITQIQNAITAGTDIIYIFPAGDGATYYDVLQVAREEGVKTLVSHNYPGEGGAEAYVGADEFQMGAMMTAMVSEWVDESFPDAGADEVDVLIVESTYDEKMFGNEINWREVLKGRGAYINLLCED